MTTRSWPFTWLCMGTVTYCISNKLIIFWFQITLVSVSDCAKKREYVEKVYDVKEFKKLLRTRTNVLVLFMKSGLCALSQRHLVYWYFWALGLFLKNWVLNVEPCERQYHSRINKYLSPRFVWEGSLERASLEYTENTSLLILLSTLKIIINTQHRQ